MTRYKVGILGGGQLARMSVMAASRLGISTLTLDPDRDSPAAQVGASVLGQITDPEAIAAVMRSCEFITFENEFIPAESLRQACALAQFDPKRITPRIETLEVIQDKLSQRLAYFSNTIPSPVAVAARDAASIGFPCVLKARFGGYDGKGTRFVNDENDLEVALATVNSDAWLAEQFVPFVRELAVMVCADEDKVACFPAMVTEQVNHVCDLVTEVRELGVATNAIEVAKLAVEAVGGKGLFGVELFELADGTISVNEIAPRPHNSGHYTMDWGGTSQFEAHILLTINAFGGLSHGLSTCMVNLLGQPSAGKYDQALVALTETFPAARMHWYGKSEVKVGRKMGHINVPGQANNIDTAKSARSHFYASWITR